MKINWMRVIIIAGLSCIGAGLVLSSLSPIIGLIFGCVAVLIL